MVRPLTAILVRFTRKETLARSRQTSCRTSLGAQRRRQSPLLYCPAPMSSPTRPHSTTPRLRDRALARSLPLVPRRMVRHFSAPYIAGETLAEAIATVQTLRRGGMLTTLDVLGESIRRRYEAEQTRDAYVEALDRLASLDDQAAINVSVKLTALGLGIDDSLAYDLTRELAERTSQLGGFLRIDMEDTPWTDQTLETYRHLRADGFESTGVVLQSYLRRSMRDAESMAAMGARVRLVKGIYVEPEELAWRDMAAINDSYIELSRVLLDAGCHVAWATHDEELVRRTGELVREYDVKPDGYEYQMLLGVQEPLRNRLVAEGHSVRIYVPYGARWYEYSLRRLRENPRIAGHVAADVLGGMRARLRRDQRTSPSSHTSVRPARSERAR